MTLISLNVFICKFVFKSQFKLSLRTHLSTRHKKVEDKYQENYTSCNLMLLIRWSNGDKNISLLLRLATERKTDRKNRNFPCRNRLSFVRFHADTDFGAETERIGKQFRFSYPNRLPTAGILYNIVIRLNKDLRSRYTLKQTRLLVKIMSMIAAYCIGKLNSWKRRSICSIILRRSMRQRYHVG